MITYVFTNNRFYDKIFFIDPFTAKKKISLEETNIYSNTSISEIRNFLLLEDKDKMLLDFWPIIKKKATTQEET